MQEPCACGRAEDFLKLEMKLSVVNDRVASESWVFQKVVVCCSRKILVSP